MKKMLLKPAVPAVIIALTFFADCSNPLGGGKDTSLLILPGGNNGPSGVAVTGVSLDQSTLTLGAAIGMAALIPTVMPGDATNKNVTWSSSDTGVASVNNGVVSAVAAGTATITVTTQDGGYTDTCTVTVTDYAIGLDQSGTFTFTEAVEGYGPQTPVTVTVSNTENQPTGALTVALDDYTSFILSTTSISSIGVSGNDSFTVVPKTALAVGTYTATVTVS
ncbi:MAG: Ig-like domain-containing protein, partial [Treponema sp.]|nr:Ig-like domain-containing protein [Treponema sp.]